MLLMLTLLRVGRESFATMCYPDRCTRSFWTVKERPSGTGSLSEVMNTLLPHQMAIKPASQQVGMYFTTKKIKQLLSRSLGRPELAAFACLLLQVVPTSSSRRRFLLAGLPVLPVVWVSHPVPRLRNRSRKS